jgi:hypothetical protein
MHERRGRRRTGGLAVAIALGTSSLLAAPAPEAAPTPTVLRGFVSDPSGAAVRGADVEVTGQGLRREARTNERGEWSVEGVPPGLYRVEVNRRGFSAFVTEAPVGVRGRAAVDARLELAPVRERLDVTGSRERETAAAGTIVLEGADLDALPDDTDALLAALAALAGAPPGPGGIQLVVDGFSGGRVPPKSAIRLVRLNASPYSAEYDRPGFSRVEILTKAGGGEWHGHAQGRFGGDRLDARDPFASAKPDYRRLAGSGAVSGPLVRGRSSFFVDFERQARDTTRLVHALALDPGFTVASLSEAIVAPSSRASVSPRLDAQLGAHTLLARYSFTSSTQHAAGVGGFALPSRAFADSFRQHVLQLADTVPLGRVVLETRLQWSSLAARQDPASLEPALLVQDAFAAGGADVGPSSSRQDRLELHNVTSWVSGRHAVRAGLRLRHARRSSDSRAGWNGTVTFAGSLGPALDAAGRPVVDAAGAPVIVPLTSLERYRRTLLFQSHGLAPDAIRALGGGASQLRVGGGDPVAGVSESDVAVFVQDDWRLRRDLALGLGLRAEAQSALGRGLDLAPRASLAFTPGHRGRGAPRTVVRAGLGVFYERIDESLGLEARRLDGRHAWEHLITEPDVLDLVRLDAKGGVASLPSLGAREGGSQVPVVRRRADDLRAPVSLQASLGVDRTQGALVLNAQWRHTRTWRALRSRVVATDGADAATEYRYESTGRARQDELSLGLQRPFGGRLSLQSRYFLSFTRSDTDGPWDFPASSRDPGADWGPSARDVRHRLVLLASLTLPGDVRLSPFLTASSGEPYDIVVGRDLDGDTVFADRPAYASDPSRPGVVRTPWGVLDPAPLPGEAIVPRNLGRGPGHASLNVRLSRSFRLDPRRPAGPQVTASLYAQNLLGRVNPSAPVGNLASPGFGRSLSSSGSVRSVELQLAGSF